MIDVNTMSEHVKLKMLRKIENSIYLLKYLASSRIVVGIWIRKNIANNERWWHQKVLSYWRIDQWKYKKLTSGLQNNVIC